MGSDRATIHVPDSDVASFRRLANADVDVLRSIAEALRLQAPDLDPDALSAAVAYRTGGDPGVIGPLIHALMHLALVQRWLGADVSDILDRLDFSGTEAWTEQDTGRWAERRSVLGCLLDPAGALARAAKAGELLLEQQMRFTECRILTDVRPVFDDDAERINAFVVFHTLSIAYDENGQNRRIGVALDASDLADLGEQVERAQRKETRVAKLLRTSDLTVIGTGADADAEEIPSSSGG